MKKILSIILKISITFALLIFLFKKTDFKAIFGIIKYADPFKMSLAFIVFLFLNVLVFLRWRLLLKSLGLKIKSRRVFLTYLSSQFFNLIFPSMIGGDVMRTCEISSHTNRHSSDILATVILDRLAGFFGLSTILIFAVIFSFKILCDVSILSVSAVLLFFLFFLSGIMFSGRFFKKIFGSLPFEKVKDYLRKIHEASIGYRSKKKVLIGAWFISVVTQLGSSIIYYLVAQSIGVNLPFMYFLIFVPVITVFSIIPVSVGGLGVRDAASVFLFSKIGIAAEKAFALSLVNFGFIFILGLLGGVNYVFGLYRRRVQCN